MAILIPFVVLVYAVLNATAFSIPPVRNYVSASHTQQMPLQDTLESWIEKEERVALDKLLANVAPGGRNVKDAAKGSVIASPSTDRPNYFYQCACT